LGFRGALGYEWNYFRFALESGYSRITGTNPLVTEIDLIPLVFKFGYALPVYHIFGVQADLGLGTVFSRTIRYETAVDMVVGNLIEDNERSFLAGARLYATLSPTVSPLSFFKIYAGGGADVIFEKDGPIPLPLLEAGISIKPFKAVSGIIKQPKEKNSAITNAVYFEINSVSINEEYLHVLDEAGQQLADNPSRRLTLRAYYTQSGAEKQVRHSTGEPALSAARAKWCAEYLFENYDVDASRIKIEYRNAGGASENFRAVELIVR